MVEVVVEGADVEEFPSCPKVQLLLQRSCCGFLTPYHANNLLSQVCGMRFREALRVKLLCKKLRRQLNVKSLFRNSMKTLDMLQACPWALVADPDEETSEEGVEEVVGDAGLKEMQKARTGSAHLVPT